jgi:hypothetical protein
MSPLMTFGQNLKLEIIKSIEASSDDFAHVDKLEELIDGERWGFHSGAIGKPLATSTLISQAKNDYKIENIHDLDLTTAWVDGKDDYGIGESFSIEFSFKEEYEGFGKVYNFYGVIELFNGYCKSEKHWSENSRIKRLKMFFNETPVCFVELVDTWQYQRIDLRKFFKEPNSFPHAPFEVKDGDKLRFEIVEVYKGTKYKDTALSEFVFESSGN